MYRRSGLVISREQGLRYDAGFAVPALMSWWGMDMGHCKGLCWLLTEAVCVGEQ